MKLDTREYFRLSVIYTTVAAVPPLLQIIVRPFIEGPGRLAAADFSRIEISETISTLAFIIAIFAMGNSISRFYYDYLDSREGYKKLVSSIFSSIILRGALLIMLVFALSNHIGKAFSQPELRDFGSYGYASVIVGINRAIAMTAFALFRNEKRIRAFVVFNLLLGLFRTAFQVTGVFMYDMSFRGYVYGSAIGSSISGLAILVFIYLQTGIRFDRGIFKETHSFAAPLFQYALLAWGITYADRYFLEGMPEKLGIYSQATNLAMGLQLIIQGLQAATQPEVYRFMKDGIEKNEAEIRKVSNLLMAQSQVIIALAILPAMLYISLLFETSLKLAAGFVAIVFITYTQKTLYIIFSFPVYFQKKTRFFLYLNIVVMAVNLLLLYLLIPPLGIYGAVGAVLVSQTLQVIGIYHYQKRIVTIRWNLNKLMVYPFAIIALTVLLEVARNLAGVSPYVSSSLVVVAIFASNILLYKNELKGFIRKKWSRSSSTGR